MSKMHAVYHNSAVTLVAAVTISAWDRLLIISDPVELCGPSLSSIEISNKAPEQISRKVNFRPKPLYYEEYDPINARAWTIQEHLMFRHLVIFAHEGIEMVYKDLLHMLSTK